MRLLGLGALVPSIGWATGWTSDVANTIRRRLVSSTDGGLVDFGAAFALRGQDSVLRVTAGCLVFAAAWAAVWLASPGGREEVFGLFALLKRVRAGNGAV